MPSEYTRRTFLKAVAAGAGVFALRPAWGAAPRRRLALHNIHTGEELDLEYGSAEACEPAARARIDRFFRCHYTQEATSMDLRTVDLLADLQQRLGCERIRIISGYRSPTYNQLLRRQGRGVASGSLHLKGMAIDWAVPGMKTDELFRLARSYCVGGVGKYPDFVHVDSGRVRYW